jgi:hypothetical protein
METKHYIDGQQNGGVYNSLNHNTYGYCYQSPVKLVDPNGKQIKSSTLGGYAAEQIGGNTGVAIGFIVDLPTNTFGALLRFTTLNSEEQQTLEKINKQILKENGITL